MELVAASGLRCGEHLALAAPAVHLGAREIEVLCQVLGKKTPDGGRLALPKGGKTRATVFGLDRGDRLDQVLDAWTAKEKMRDVYLTDDIEVATERVDEVITFNTGSDVAKVNTLSESLRRWRTAILAHHMPGASNGPTEAVNLTI